MIIATRATTETIDRLDNLLSSEDRVFYTRFGDGDILLMSGRDDKYHNSSVDLRDELVESFLIDDEQYLRGLAVNYPLEEGMMHGLFAPHHNNEELQRLVQEVLLPNPKPGKFESHIVFHYYAIFRQKEFNNFFDLHIRPKRKLLVGGIPSEIACKLYGLIDEYIETPMSDAYRSVDTWWPEVERLVNKVDLVIPSAGAASKVINKRLWNLDAEVNSLDIGSLIDGIDGRGTRKWIKLKGHRMNAVLLPEYRDKSLSRYFRFFWKESYFQLRKMWKKISSS